MSAGSRYGGRPFTLTTGGGGLVASGSSTGTAAQVAISVAPQSFSTLFATDAAPIFVSETLGGSETLAVNDGVSADRGILGRVRALVGNDSSGLLMFSVPLSVGVTPSGGNPFLQLTTLVSGYDVPVTVTASAFGWTTGTFSFASSTTDGVPIPTPFVAAGSNDLSAGGSGSITLIAPSITSVCVSSPFASFPCNGASHQSTSASVTTLTLNFVPEPGTLLLLGAGLGGLAAMGRSHRA